MDEKPETPPPAAPSTTARAKAEFILSRIFGLFRDPNREWQEIKAEETNPASLMLGYVAPLAAIPPLCGAIGVLAFGRGMLGSPGEVIVDHIVSFIVLVAVVFFLGFLVNSIADNFEGEKNELAAMKVAAYAPTPAFLGGFFALSPNLWWIGLIGVGLAAYLFYLGLGALMKVPQDRLPSYAATIVLAGVVTLLVLLALASCVT